MDNYPHPFDTSLVRTEISQPVNPGAGLEANIFIAGATNLNFRVLLIALNYDFTADANVANRVPTLLYTDSGVTFEISYTNGPITASTTRHVNFSLAYSNRIAITSGEVQIGQLNPLAWVLPQQGVITEHLNLQAGDTITNIVAFYAVQPTF